MTPTPCSSLQKNSSKVLSMCFHLLPFFLEPTLIKLSPPPLVKVPSELHGATSRGQFSVLILLDSQQHLTQLTSNTRPSLGSYDTTFSCFSCSFTSHFFSVSFAHPSSSTKPPDIGVRQDSTLGPWLRRHSLTAANPHPNAYSSQI